MCRTLCWAPLRRRLIFAALLSVPVLLMAMIPALQFDNFQWLSLTMIAPVVVWGAWPFHRAAWANLRHGAATMDTLISVGTLAAFAWSVYALFLGTAGTPGTRPRPPPRAWSATATAACCTTAAPRATR